MNYINTYVDYSETNMKTNRDKQRQTCLFKYSKVKKNGSKISRLKILMFYRNFASTRRGGHSPYLMSAVKGVFLQLSKVLVRVCFQYFSHDDPACKGMFP